MTATHASEPKYQNIELSEVASTGFRTWPTRLTVIGLEFVILFAFWVMLSGHYQIKYIVIGLCASAVVTFLTHDYLYARSKRNGSDVKSILKSGIRWIVYIPWLIVAIFKANIQVAAILIKPKMTIDPGLLKMKSDVRKKISKVTLANSITITPGTITLEQKGDTYILHALVRECAGDLETALLQNKVAAIFDDETDKPPHCTWGHCREELEK